MKYFCQKTCISKDQRLGLLHDSENHIYPRKTTITSVPVILYETLLQVQFFIS